MYACLVIVVSMIKIFNMFALHLDVPTNNLSQKNIVEDV